MDRELQEMLVGATILDTGEREAEGVTYPRILVRTRAGRFLNLFVQSDEEGNAGGFVEAEEVDSTGVVRNATAPRAE